MAEKTVSQTKGIADAIGNSCCLLSAIALQRVAHDHVEGNSVDKGCWRHGGRGPLTAADLRPTQVAEIKPEDFIRRRGGNQMPAPTSQLRWQVPQIGLGSVDTPTSPKPCPLFEINAESSMPLPLDDLLATQGNVTWSE
jgi:hypothetical protein